MRYYFLLVLIVWSWSGEKIPKEVLPPEKMGAVWYDVILADELTDFSSITDSTFREFSKRTALYDSIFHIHAITKEQYRKSEKYYQDRPDLLKKILADLQKKADTAVQKEADTSKKKKAINPV
ncbi:MAG TPA: DUF4296 domain-containing protein [Flavisolibacter sp.]|jgi:hypothetical protein